MELDHLVASLVHVDPQAISTRMEDLWVAQAVESKAFPMLPAGEHPLYRRIQEVDMVWA